MHDQGTADLYESEQKEGTKRTKKKSQKVKQNAPRKSATDGMRPKQSTAKCMLAPNCKTERPVLDCMTSTKEEARRMAECACAWEKIPEKERVLHTNSPHFHSIREYANNCSR